MCVKRARMLQAHLQAQWKALAVRGPKLRVLYKRGICSLTSIPASVCPPRTVCRPGEKVDLGSPGPRDQQVLHALCVLPPLEAALKCVGVRGEAVAESTGVEVRAGFGKHLHNGKASLVAGYLQRYRG